MPPKCKPSAAYAVGVPGDTTLRRRARSTQIPAADRYRQSKSNARFDWPKMPANVAGLPKSGDPCGDARGDISGEIIASHPHASLACDLTALDRHRRRLAKANANAANRAPASKTTRRTGPRLRPRRG